MRFYLGKQSTHSFSMLIPQFQKIDLQRLLDNANNFSTWLSILPPELEPKKVGNSYRFMASGGLSLYFPPSGKLILKNFSQKTDLPTGNLFQVVCHIHNLQPKGNAADFQKACEIIAEASGQSLSKVSSLPKWRQNSLVIKPSEPTVWQPNAQKSVSKNFDFEIGARSGTHWEAIISYFSTWGIKTPTLEKYGIFPLSNLKKERWTKAICFSERDLSFVYCIDGQNSTIKAKRPFANTKKGHLKEFYLQNSGNYVFGYTQLPAKGKTLVIAAGEKDTLTINQHLNQYGIYAICFSGENARIDAQYLNELRQRFQQVFTCFDNDQHKTRNTGLINMQKWALELALPYINIASHSNQKDVSDIVQYEGVKALKDIFFNEIRTKTAVAVRPNDRFSIGVADVLRLDIERYLSEKLDYLAEYILANPRLILQSPTGTGKTWAFMKLVTETNFLKKNQLRHLIFCVPTTAILEQLSRDFESECKTQPALVQGFSSDLDIQMALHSSIILTTYDSLHKINSAVENAILVVDEFHELRNAHQYREKAVQEVFEYMQFSKCSVAVSATPLYAFTLPNLINQPFRLCKVNCKQTQKITIQPFIYEEGKESDIFQHRLENTENSQATHIIKKNDVTMLESFQAKAVENGLSFDIFSSKNEIYKSQNANYQSIMSTGQLKEYKNWIGCTSLFDAGASFKFPVGSVTFINERCMDSFVQHIARARISQKSGFNKKIQVFSYHSKPKHKQDFYTPASHNFTQLLKEFSTLAEAKADFCNGLKPLEEEDANGDAVYKYQDTDFVHYSPLWGEWVVDTLAILNKLHQIEIAESSLEEYYSRMEYYYPHISIEPIQHLDLATDTSTREILGGKSQEKKQLIAQFQTLWQQTNIDSLLEAIWHSTSHSKLKIQIQQAIPIARKSISYSAQQLLDTYPKIFKLEIPQLYALHFFSLRKLGLSSKVCCQMVAQHPKQSQFKQFYNTLVSQIELYLQREEIMSEQGLLRLLGYHAIIDNIEKLRRKVGINPDLTIGKNDLGLSKKQLYKIISEVIEQSHLNFKEIKLKVQELFHVHTTRTKRHGKQRVVFVIGQAHNIQDLIKPYGLLISDVDWKITTK